MTLAVSGVVLFVFVFLVVVGLGVVAAVYLSKAYTARQRYGLARHAYDKDGPDGLKAMTEALRGLDSELPWRPSGIQSIPERPVPPPADISLSARQVPALNPPEEQFRER